MRKAAGFIIFVIICVCLCSCGKDEARKIGEDTENQSSVSSAYQTDNEKQTDSESRSIADTIAYYSERYSAKSVYGDMLNNLKYILVGEKDIVELLAIDGLEQTKIIPIDNIERVESKSISGYNEIKIFDKTNQSISVILDSQKAEELLGMID